MNKRQTNNKNMKRIAITAGVTAAALFLAAGFVASRGNGSENKTETAAQAIEVPVEVAATPVAEEVVVDTTVAEVSETRESKGESTKTATPQTTKKTKGKQSSATGGGVIVAVPEAGTEANTASPIAETDSIARGSEQTDAQQVTTPANQPAVEQPAVEQAPSAEQQATSNGTTSASVPQWSITNNFSSKLQAVDLSKPTVTIPCIPNYTC